MARGHGFRARSPGRLTQWFGPAAQNYVAVASGGATLVASLPFESANTVVRSRGQVSIRASVYSADVDIIGAFGMAVVSAEALAIGVTAIPEPFGDADWGGWFVWRSFSHHFESISQAGVLLGSWEFEVDSKAMRRVGVNEAVVLIAESNNGAFQISSPVRMLVKLS